MKEPSKEVQQVIRKTVDYVKRNGTSFEKKLQESALDKFPFLNPSDEHHEYYKQLLDDGNEDHAQEIDNIDKMKNTRVVRELKFVIDPPAVSKLDLDIIKLTALFTARNGDEYASRIHSFQRKVNNSAQFEFLNREHSLYDLFRQYVNQYRILHSIFESKDTPEAIEINNYLKDPREVYNFAYERAKKEKSEKTSLKKEKQEQKDKLLYYASIDWQDFAIVEKIEFDAVDQVKELEPPVTRDSLIYRSLEDKHNNEGSFKAVPRTVEVLPTKQKLDKPYGMKIRAAGESRLKNAGGGLGVSAKEEHTIKCPLTERQIPESQFEEHLKVLLRDPRYKEQQDNFMKKNFKYSSNLSTDEVYDNIKRLVKKRDYTDSDTKSKRRQIGPS